MVSVIIVDHPGVISEPNCSCDHWNCSKNWCNPKTWILRSKVVSIDAIWSVDTCGDIYKVKKLPSSKLLHLVVHNCSRICQNIILITFELPKWHIFNDYWREVLMRDQIVLYKFGFLAYTTVNTVTFIQNETQLRFVRNGSFSSFSTD
jgi:hypothetical protein